jgi:nicotinamide mononucleotide transporter
MSALEIAANATNLLCVYLAARNKVWNWPVGLVGCVLYALMFFGVKLYADVTLQGFFILTGFIGWWNWVSGARRAQPPVTRAGIAALIYGLFGAALTAAAYGHLLHATTDASFPFIDSLILTFSVAAQFLLMGRRLETWIFWFIVNTLAVPLYAAKGLYLTSFVYLLFWFNAVHGYQVWRKQMRAAHV